MIAPYPSRTPPLLLLALTIPVAGCAGGFGNRPCSAEDDASILAVGDSILAYHSGGCASIPDVIGAELDRPVRNASQSGAQLAAAPDFSWGVIPDQYVVGAWEWVVVEGGINDLNSDCACDACEGVLDELVSVDGSVGVLPALVDRALDDGARVALLGYHEVPATADFGFGACEETWLPRLRARQAALAQTRPSVFYVDPSSAITKETSPEAYYSDDIHPSREGSALVGALVAETIRAAEDDS